MATERTLLTLEALSAWMTEKVQQFEDCEGTTVTIQYQLATPDTHGCNWSENVFSIQVQMPQRIRY